MDYQTFNKHIAHSEFNPIDRYIAIEMLKNELLPLIEPLMDKHAKINIDVNSDNHLLINNVPISKDFRYVSSFTNTMFGGYLFFDDNGKGTFVNFGIKNLYDCNKVYEVFRLYNNDKRIKNILYRDDEIKGTPLISFFTKEDEWDEVQAIIESEGLNNDWI